MNIFKTKKFLSAILLLLLIVTAGCSGNSMEEEAKQINQKYYVEGYQNGVYKEMITLLGPKVINNEKVTEDERAQLRKNSSDFLTAVKNIEIKNERNLPLKEKILTIAENWNTYCTTTDKEKWEQSVEYIDNSKLYFDYENEFSNITTKKGLPTISTGGHRYRAYMASDVLFTITDHYSTQSLGEGMWAERPQGEFRVVKVFTYNNQKDAVTIDSACFKLLDKENREFSVSSRGMTALQFSSHHNKGFLQELNPTMSFEAMYVFDVPKNSIPENFTLQARGGMTGSKVLIPLFPRPIID